MTVGFTLDHGKRMRDHSRSWSRSCLFGTDDMLSTAPPLDPPPQPLDLLVVAAHPDDAEISVGGTIAKAVGEGLRVGVLDLTSGEPTPRGSDETRIRETSSASKALGLTWRGQLGLPNRMLQNDLPSRRRLAEAFRLLRSRVILAHHWEDVHPDHVAASALVDAARFWSKLSRSDLDGEPYWPEQIYYFWSIHLRNMPTPSVVTDVSEHMEQKLEAVRCYQSQLSIAANEPFPNVIDDIRDRARYWGWSIHAAYGEPLLCREQIAVRRVGDLFAK